MDIEREERPEPTFNAQAVLEARLKEVQEASAKPGASEKAYFDDDSISTLGSITYNTPQSNKKMSSTTSTPSEYRHSISSSLTDSDRYNSRYAEALDNQSITSTVTMESVQLMIEHRIGGIETMMKQILQNVQADKNDQSLSSTVTTHNTGESSETPGRGL